MWQVRGQVLLTHLDKIGWEKGRRERERGKQTKRERERNKAFRVRSSHFSLDLPMIEPAVAGGVRGRVYPRS